jgi:hypothetical protein
MISVNVFFFINRSIAKNFAFFLIGVKIAIECNGITLMPAVA